MNQLIKTERQLPATIEELHQFILIGKERLNAHRAKIRAIDKLQIAHVAKEAALNDAQDLADILLDAESKMGEMLESIPDKKASSGAGTRSLPSDITKKESHFAQMVARNPEVVIEIKQKAREEGRLATTQDVIREIQKQKHGINLPLQIPLPPEGKFAVIMIDPPWPYGTEYDPETRRIASPYPEMTIEELSKLEIPGADVSVMWLWTTHKFLPDAFSLMNLWNYEYKITVAWNKEKMGMGSWLRCQIEFCLLGIRNKPTWELTNQTDFISEARREHSRKPNRIYEMAEELFPGPKDETFYLDYFSREKREGWKQTGNEPDKF